MSNSDTRIDAYIAKSADFARPILEHLRKLVHAACPDIEEALKWGMPHFLHKGIVCSMAAFKQHCAFSFWKGNLIFGRGKSAAKGVAPAMGQFGRISARSDLPPDKVLIGYIRKAVRLNEEGVKAPARARPKKSAKRVVPEDLQAELKKSRQAQRQFEMFSQSHKNEYIEWITGAKRPETRQKRLATTIQWLTEGKSRNWKYQNS